MSNNHILVIPYIHWGSFRIGKITIYQRNGTLPGTE